MLAALSTLGAFCLTTIGGGNEYCVPNDSQNPKECYRRPYVDLPLSWLSTITRGWKPSSKPLRVALTYFQFSPQSLCLSFSACMMMRHTRGLHRMTMGHSPLDVILWI